MNGRHLHRPADDVGRGSRRYRAPAGAGGRGRGFTLMEVLVSVLILSVGVLGVAGLQTLSLQNTSNSLLRTRATMMAYEIIDRARANRGQSYAIALADPAPVGVDCEIQNCNPAQLRDYEQTVWKNDLGADLPNGNGSIVIAGASMTVTVQWQDDRRIAGAGLLNVAVETTL